MYLFNQAFNLDSTLVSNGIKFVVKDSNQSNLVVYETENYISQSGMGIVELHLPSPYFRGSVWVMSITDNSPIDVIAINPPDLGITNHDSETIIFQLWVVQADGRGATDCYISIKDLVTNLLFALKPVGVSGYTSFNLQSNKEYLINICDLTDTCIQTRTVNITSQNLHMTISV